MGKKTRAYAEIELDDLLLIKGIRIVESSRGGLFISMPSIKTSKGEYKPFVVFKDKSFESKLRKNIIEAFHHLGVNQYDEEKNKNDNETL